MILWTLRKVRRVVIAVVGFTVLAIGMAMIVLPGPAVVVIPIGLGILATEFVWARVMLDKVHGGLKDLIRRTNWSKKKGVGCSKQKKD